MGGYHGRVREGNDRDLNVGIYLEKGLTEVSRKGGNAALPRRISPDETHRKAFLSPITSSVGHHTTLLPLDCRFRNAKILWEGSGKIKPVLSFTP
jgi:hypothetical protein